MSLNPERFNRLETIELPPPLESIQTLSAQIAYATNLAAIAAARTRGGGDKKLSDEKAVEALFGHLNNMDIEGRVVIGEGEKDKAPQIKTGEILGTGKGLKVDIALDPLEGTTLTSKYLDGAICVIALSERGGLLGASDDIVYQDKLVVGPAVAGKINIEALPVENLQIIANSLNRNIESLTIVILDRKRNKPLIDVIRKTGANVMAITDGDLLPGIATCMEGSGIHALMGIGGSAEGVITAAAVRCLGGEMQIKWWPKNDEEKAKLQHANLNPERVYTHNDLASGRWIVFSATAVTDSLLGLEGVHFFGGGLRTHSLLIEMFGAHNLIKYTDDIFRESPSIPLRI